MDFNAGGTWEGDPRPVAVHWKRKIRNVKNQNHRWVQRQTYRVSQSFFLVVCLCILRRDKTWGFLTWTSNTKNRNSWDPEDYECGDTGQLLFFWIHFLANQSRTENMDTLEFMILDLVMMCFGILALEYLWKPHFFDFQWWNVSSIFFEPISDHNWPHWSRW